MNFYYKFIFVFVVLFSVVNSGKYFIRNFIVKFVFYLKFNFLAKSLKCYTCFTEHDCERAIPTVCNFESAKITASHFSFLQRAAYQPNSGQYNCATYKATLSKLKKNL